jgi:hypothetical protein
VAAVVAAVAAGIVGIVLAVTSDDDAPANAAPNTTTVTTTVSVKSDPEPISRAELMAEYARIAPMDRSATPETIDGLAKRMCELLVGGTPTDEVISKATDIYGAQATEVVRLMASYGCPKELAEFK